MADYFIGDLQGCFEGFKRALAEVEFNPSKDTLWLTGDLIARGEDSRRTLKYVYKKQDSIRTVLGNHDLHFLAVVNGLKRANPKDNLESLINHEKCSLYVDWLRQQPLIQRLPNDEGYMTHAGLSPQWSAKQAVKYAKAVSEELKSDGYQDFLPLMYGTKPSLWSKELSHLEKLKYSVSAFTRMRFCHANNGELDFINKGHPSKVDETEGLKPWYEFETERFDKNKWVFGHWASLMADTKNSNVIGLDTGYIWGGYLSVLNWQTKELIKVHHQK